MICSDDEMFPAATEICKVTVCLQHTFICFHSYWCSWCILCEYEV